MSICVLWSDMIDQLGHIYKFFKKYVHGIDEYDDDIAGEMKEVLSELQDDIDKIQDFLEANYILE